MKLFYVANSKIPTEKAFGYGIAKMCEQFGDKYETTLIIPYFKNLKSSDVFEFYSIKNNFKIRNVFTIDVFKYEKYLGRLVYWVQTISFCFGLLFIDFDKDSIIYSRDLIILPFLRLKSRNLFLEIHFLQNTQKFLRALFRLAKGVVTTTQALKNQIVSFGIEKSKILVAHDAVDLEKFDVDISTEEARTKLGLSLDRIILGYTGSFKAMGMEKGIENVLPAIKILKEKYPKILFLAVGGSALDVVFYNELIQREGLGDYVSLLRRVSVDRLPLYQKAFDALIYYPSFNEYFAYHTSPLKIFEYMASKKPIIVSDLPSMREILSTDNSFLVKPGDLPELVKVIDFVINNSKFSVQIAMTAYNDVHSHTWRERANLILNFCKII